MPQPSGLLDAQGNPVPPGPPETDAQMAQRCGPLFGFAKGWSVNVDAQGNLALYAVPPVTVP